MHQSHSFYFDGGIKSFVRYLNEDLHPKHNSIFYVAKEWEEGLVEVALQYVDDLQSKLEDWPFDKIVRFNNQAKSLVSNESLIH